MVKGKRTLKRLKTKTNIFSTQMKILVPIIIILIIVIIALEQGNINKDEELGLKTVKVLVYCGSGTSSNSVLEIENCLDKSNSKKIVSDVKFVYNTTNVINNKTLSGYDVLIMPGSSEGYDYLDNQDINVDDLKSFIASGKGFLGICAGAYSGAEYTENWYNGWGIAPNVINEPALQTGNLTINITTAGNQLLGYSGGKVISHINGPAMYASGGEVITFATYADKNTSYNGSAAIIGDYYGEGRTVLSGVHPELEPQDPDMLAYLVLWAYNGTLNITNTSTSE